MAHAQRHRHASGAPRAPGRDHPVDPGLGQDRDPTPGEVIRPAAREERRGEAPRCPVYVDGRRLTTLEGTTEELATAFEAIVDEYVATRYPRRASTVGS